jgi:cobaltochelatase CobT
MAAGKSESPTDTFKRALAHAARSLAEQPDLEVVFSGDGPSLVGHRATLPHPPRDLNEREAARIRGLADQMALRLAHHDAATHGRLRPHDAQAAGVFEAIEQARIEAIGANALSGVRKNLTTALEASLERKGFARTPVEAAPMADVIGMIVRERLTGEPAPELARPLIEALRPAIEAKAGKDLDRLAASLEDQMAFARIARTILRDLEMGDDTADSRDDASEDDQDQTDQPDEGDADDTEGDGETPEGASAERSESADQDSEASEDQEMSAEDADDADMSDESPDLAGASTSRRACWTCRA